jgi:hypothetical protein
MADTMANQQNSIISLYLFKEAPGMISMHEQNPSAGEEKI